MSPLLNRYAVRHTGLKPRSPHTNHMRTRYADNIFDDNLLR